MMLFAFLSIAEDGSETSARGFIFALMCGAGGGSESPDDEGADADDI